MSHLEQCLTRAANAATRKLESARDRALRWRKGRFAARHPLPTIRLGDIIGDREIELPAPILDEICMPPFAGPSHDDYGALMRLVAHFRPRHIVELGTAHGNTVANLCRIHDGCHIVTVNAPCDLQTGILTTYELTQTDIGRVYRKHGYCDRVTQVYVNSLDLDLSQFVDHGSVDLAIIDACHDTEYVLNDFEKCRPFMADHGIMLLHDTHPSLEGHLLGSYLACVELRRRGFDVRHLDETWWGVLRPHGFLEGTESR